MCIFSTNIPSEFSGTLSKLDEFISEFPRGNGVPFHMSYFKNGVSEYLKSALKTKTNMGVGTCGLGSMRFQDMPSVLLQIMLCKFKYNYITVKLYDCKQMTILV